MLIKIQRSKDTQCPLKKKVFSFLCISAHKDKVFQPINQRMSIKMSKRRLNSPMQLLLQRSKKQSFWAIKIKFFSGPLIDFMLHLLDIAFIILVQ